MVVILSLGSGNAVCILQVGQACGLINRWSGRELNKLQLNFRGSPTAQLNRYVLTAAIEVIDVLHS